MKRRGASGPYVENNPAGYTIRIVRRGEQILYDEGHRRLEAEVCVVPPRELYSDSIVEWHDGTPVTPEEKALVIERLVSYFERYQHASIRVR